MKQFCRALFVLWTLALASSPIATAQAPGSILFAVRITPSTGVAEPVRGLPFYLLRKSFGAIEQQAAESQPPPDLGKFIDSLSVSKELKAWMKKHHTVRITGEGFAKNLTAQEILTVPEFWKAYDQLNIGNKQFGFPVAKYNDRERARKPEKYQRDVDEFHERILKYIAEHPESKDSMDAELQSIDPNPRWMEQVTARRSSIARMALDWAQSRYLVAQTQSDLNGRAQFGDIPPGNYWITCLNINAEVGDTRAKWDVPVTVRAGTATQLLLSNYNSVPPADAAF